MLADVGIPMIFVQWPLMFYALIPVIVVEALLIRRWVSLSYREAFTGIAKANPTENFWNAKRANGIYVCRRKNSFRRRTFPARHRSEGVDVIL